MDNLEVIEKNAKRSVYFAAASVSVAITAYVYWFLLEQKSSLSTNTEHWGQFGDFVGGLLNPLIAYLAFYWLITSIRIQKQELKETRSELSETRKAQEMQARIQLLSSQMSGYRTRLEIIITEMNCARADAEFLRESLRSGKFINHLGDWCSPDDIKLGLDALLESSTQYAKMADTIDRHIANLVQKLEDENL